MFHTLLPFFLCLMFRVLTFLKLFKEKSLQVPINYKIYAQNSSYPPFYKLMTKDVPNTPSFNLHGNIIHNINF